MDIKNTQALGRESWILVNLGEDESEIFTAKSVPHDTSEMTPGLLFQLIKTAISNPPVSTQAIGLSSD